MIRGISEDTLEKLEGVSILGLDIGGSKALPMICNISAKKLSFSLGSLVRIKEIKNCMELLQKVELQISRKLSSFDAICIGAAGMFDPNTWILHHADEYPDRQLDFGGALNALGVDRNKVRVANDFESQAEAAIGKPGQEALVISAGEPGGGPVRILGAGTGLGEACWEFNEDNGGLSLIRSEGGNAPVPWTFPWQAPFLAYVASQHLRPIKAEDILSGHGYKLCAQFIQDCLRAGKDGALKLKASGIDAKANVAIETIKIDPKEIDIAVNAGAAPGVVKLFASCLGFEARNICLKFWGEKYNPGELVFTGGVLQRCPALVNNDIFFQAFCRSQFLCPEDWIVANTYHDDVLSTVKISIMTDFSAGAYGAATHALRHLAQA